MTASAILSNRLYRFASGSTVVRPWLKHSSQESILIHTTTTAGHRRHGLPAT